MMIIMFIIYLLLVNVLAFIVYGVDKYKAVHGKWRISEASLLLMAVIGGGVGAWLGMKVWHHKTHHLKFKYGVPAIVVVHLVLFIGMLHIFPTFHSYLHSLTGWY